MRPSLDELIAGVTAGDRGALARAITLAESRLPADQGLAQDLLIRLAPRTGRAVRLGLTGVPGAGKSTTIEALGLRLLELGHRVAVLVVDPSSVRTGGSILGDKTRMPRLSVAEGAFIRPSPSAGVLGGVAWRTREAMLLCEAAGFDVVIVESVGVGQSESELAAIVDTLCLLLVPGAGDDLQGIKRGVVELVDVVAVNKADGELLTAANRAAADYRHAVHMLPAATPGWSTPVMTYSARDGDGLMSTLYGEQSPGLVVRVHDGADTGEASLMYRSDSAGEPGEDVDQAIRRAHFQTREYVTLAGHTWTVQLSSLPEFEHAHERNASTVILVAGMLLSLLLGVDHAPAGHRPGPRDGGWRS